MSTNKSLRVFQAAFPFNMTADGTFVYSYVDLLNFLDGDSVAVCGFMKTNGLTLFADGRLS